MPESPFERFKRELGPYVPRGRVPTPAELEQEELRKHAEYVAYVDMMAAHLRELRRAEKKRRGAWGWKDWVRRMHRRLFKRE